MSAREVTLVGGSPWGFRMHGGHDLHQPLRISRVNPGSKATQQGVREGDLISSINGRSTRELTNSEAHALLRNAGDHLTLGLNQENVGSPKRRIYKSSLQENTSTETLKRTTTKTTSNTTIISTEPKSNGTDDTRHEKSAYANQNGGLKSSPGSGANEAARGFEYRYDSLDYATDAEDSCTRMPHGSRNRRTRRNRNRKRYQPSAVAEENGATVPTTNESNDESSATDAPDGGDAQEENSCEACTEARVNGNAVKVTTEHVDSEENDAGSHANASRPLTRPRNKFRIEKKAVKTETRICEITTICNLPCEAKIDHIPGVGILETSLTKEKETDANVTVIEPLEPLSTTVSSKVKTLGDQKFALTLLKKDNSLDIHEVSDSDVEPDNSRVVVVVEAESDVEKEPDGELVVLEKDPEEEKVEEHSNLEQYYAKLKPKTIEETIVEEDEAEERSSVERNCDASEEKVGAEEIISEEVVEEEESAPEEREMAKAENNDESAVSKDKESVKPEAPMSKEVEMKLRTFIEGLKLPSSPEEARDECQKAEKERASGNAANRKAKKRAILESYFSQTQAANRFLDIIQEEGEKLSEDDEQHIRDFINEEISKYRREGRNVRGRHNSEEDTEEQTAQSIVAESETLEGRPHSILKKNNDGEAASLANKEVGVETRVTRVTASLRELPVVQEVKRENLHEPEDCSSLKFHEEERVEDHRQECPLNIDSSKNPTCNNINGYLPDDWQHPPPPPKRSSSFSSDSESFRPPTPPEIDYASDLPEVPPPPNHAHIGPKVSATAPAPPVRGKTVHFADVQEIYDLPERPPPPGGNATNGAVGIESTYYPPERPPPPGASTDDDARSSPVYENVDFAARRPQSWRAVEPLPSPPPLPPPPVNTERKVHICESNVKTEQDTVDFVKTLLAVLSRHDTTSQDVQNIVSGFDLAQLPPNIREIVDDLVSPSSHASTESDNTDELRNAERSTATLGNDASLEIAHEPLNEVAEKFVKSTPWGDSAPTWSRDVTESSRAVNGPTSAVSKHCEIKEFSRETWSSSETRNGFRKEESRSEQLVNEESHDTKIFSEGERDKSVRQFSEKREEKSATLDAKIVEPRSDGPEETRYNLEHRQNTEEKRSSQLRVKNSRTEVVSNDCEKTQTSDEVCTSSSGARGGTDESGVAANDSPDDRTEAECTTNAVSPTDFQRQDSSPSSTASLSTAKYNPTRSSLVDIEATAEDNAKDGKTKESPQPKRRLNLLKDLSKEENEDQETPPPIPYSPIEDLYYVPLERQELEKPANPSEKDSTTKSERQPNLLKDLCIKRILSMPYGLQVINEITLPKFNIFKNLQTIQESVNSRAESAGKPLNTRGVNEEPPNNSASNSDDQRQRERPPDSRELPADTTTGSTTVSEKIITSQLSREETTIRKVSSYSSSSETKTSEEMQRCQKSQDTWMGVPTVEDPRLLVCLSPSQQESKVPADADKLLDLHRKFLERRGYHEPEQRQDASVHKYRVEVRGSDGSGSESDIGGVGGRSGGRWSGDWHIPCPGNRLLEIIKENSDVAAGSTQRPSVVERDRDAIYDFYKMRHAGTATAANGVSARQAMKRVPSLEESQDRLRVTRLSDWLNLARRNSVDGGSNARAAGAGNLLIDQSSANKRESADKRSGANNQTQGGNDLSVGGCAESGRNDRRRIIDRSSTRNLKREGFESTETTNFRRSIDHDHYINSALIDRSGDTPETPGRSSTPYGKSPISVNSAIIDKSRCIPEPRKVTVQRKVDAKHIINPALINDRPEVPPKAKKPVVVDRSCIDTTSIFDKRPPRNHLQPRRYRDDLEEAKLVTAGEIMDNLKQLQTDMRVTMGDRRRYSLPQEYFDKQLKYIEALEGQLKDVILAEEEEEKRSRDKAVTEQAERQRPHSVIGVPPYRDRPLPFDERTTIPARRPPDEKSHDSWRARSVSRDDESYTDKDSWHEESKNFTDEGDSELVKKDGFREVSQRVSDRNGVKQEESTSHEKREERYVISRNGDIAHRVDADPTKGVRIERPRSTSSAIATNGEVFRQKMYNEYVHKVQEREERKQHKVIKITSHKELDKSSDSAANMNKMEKEFIEKARNRMNKFGIKLDSSESEMDAASSGTEKARDDEEEEEEEEEKEREDREAKCLIDGMEIKDAKRLPKHLQEFLKLSAEFNDDDDDDGDENMFAPTFKASSVKPGVWSPGSEPPPPPKQPSPDRGKDSDKDAGIPPVWTPNSAGPSPVAERKEFRPVQFESPVLSRKNKPQSQSSTEDAPPPWEGEGEKKEASYVVSETINSRIVNSHSAPSQGLNTLAAGAPRLPRAQNPTITLLQKAREGQLPRGAAYLDESGNDVRVRNDERPLISPGEIIYTVKKEYESEPETENEPPKKMADLGPRQFPGIGPITKEGIPLVLRSEVKENNQAKWYKKMYDSLHRADKDEDYVTIRYKPRRGARYGFGSSSGYLSEPEPRGYADKSATLDNRRRIRNKENDYSSSTVPRKAGPLKYSPDVYKNQPGRIEDYEPGRSSIADKETKEWWDEVMDIFDGWQAENGGRAASPRGRLAELEERRQLSQSTRALSLSYRPDSRHSPFDQRNAHTAKPYMSQALKESGYESDSTLVFRRRDDVNPLSPLEQRLAYKTVQRGGDVPLHGLRKPAPERPKDDSEIEYFPISPTLTRIRVHKTREPIASHLSAASSSTAMIFARYKRTAPSLTTSPFRQTGSARVETEERLAHGRSHSTPSRLSSPPPGRPPSRVVSPSSRGAPSPPRRRSSRNNSTLRLYSKMHVTGNPHASNPRHEKCFAADSVSNIRFLGDRLSRRLEKHRKDREDAQRLRITRTLSSSPSTSRTRLSSTVTADFPSGRFEPCLSRSLSEGKNVALSPERPRTRVSTSASPVSRTPRVLEARKSPAEKPQAVKRVPSKSPVSASSRESTIDRLYSPERTCHHGGRARVATTAAREDLARAHRVRRDQEEPCKRLKRPSELASPVEVRKVMQRQKERDAKDGQTRVLPCGTVVKSSTTLYSSAASGKQKNPEDKSLKVTVAISSKGRELLRRTTETSSTSRAPGSKISSAASSPLMNRRTTTTFAEPAESAKPKTTSSKPLEKLRSIGGEPLRSSSTFSADILGEVNRRKRPRERPQTIVKSPPKKPETISISPDDKDKKNDKRKIRKEKCVESSKKKNSTNGKKAEVEKKKCKKALGKAAGTEVAKELKKLNVEVKSPSPTVAELKGHQEAMKSDAFFQNLFLRNISSPTPSQSSVLRKSSVLERAKMFQELSNENFKSEPSLGTLNIYLSSKRPVSNSKFKNWERESVSSRCSSPYGVSWPGRSMFQKIGKFDSLLSVDDYPAEFGSVSSFRGRSPDVAHDRLYKERSLSEPPLKVLQEDAQVKSPEYPPPRPASPSPVRSPACRRIQSLRQQDVPGATMIRKARARSAGEAEQREIGVFGSTASLKSTSTLNLSQVDREEYQQYVLEMLHCKRKSKRYRDLHDFYASLERMGELERTASSGDLRPRLKNEEIIDFDRWKEVRSRERAERELEVLYGKLRNAQKEKDFLFRPKEAEQFKWRGDSGLRCKEKSVENIREHFRKLEREESELESSRRRDISSKKDVYKPLWRGNSVVSVANTMQRRAASSDSERSIHSSLQRSLGGSKKFWSSLSIEQVNALKNQLNEIYGSDNARPKPTARSDYEIVVPPPREEFGDPAQEDKKGLHVRCHSMVTPDICKTAEDVDRRRSHLDSPLKRSGSISRGRSIERSQSDRSVVPPMTELEKKRLSLTLSKEVLDKAIKRRSSASVAPRETRGAIAAAAAKTTATPSVTETSPRTCYSLEMSEESAARSKESKSDFLLVLTPNDETFASKRKVENVLERWSAKSPRATPEGSIVKMSRTASASELDSNTESSETSVRTVIHQGSAEDVPRKVEFYESMEHRVAPERTAAGLPPRKPKDKLSSSQSFADLKELFGETELAKYSSLPFCGSRPRSISPRLSPHASPETFSARHLYARSRERAQSASPARAPSDSSCSSESLWRRGSSPDPERYWRAYLKLARSGTVGRLRAKFESLEELSGERARIVVTPKRFQSDPELTRNLLKRTAAEEEAEPIVKAQEVVSDVGWLRRKYEPVRGRARRRGTSPPIPRVPLRLEDLGMPRINVISKLAELKEAAPRHASAPSELRTETRELAARRPVGRARKKFERDPRHGMSILGEMFTSAPNVHELRDVAPYLAGQWVAHKYPSRGDNARSLSSPELDRREPGSRAGARPSRSEEADGRRRYDKPRATSSSPIRPRRPSSILKQPTDVFANQPFDPSKHRPRYRYQPPPPTVHREIKPWWPPIPTYTARPTVTFEGPASI